MTHLPTHPTTGLTALGHTSRGPIWPIMGGDGTGEPAPNSGGDPANGDPNTNTGADSGTSNEPAATAGSNGGGGGGDLESMSQADLAKMVKDLRKENASSRTNAKQQAAAEAEQALTDKLAAALGLKEGTDAPTAEDLTNQLAERDAEVRTMRTERAAEQAARKHGADVEALLDSRAFTAKLADLDPSAASFSDDLDALVAAEVEANPRYKTTHGAPAARGGGDFSGGSGDQSHTFTNDQIQNMSPTEYAKHRDAIMRQLGG